MKKRRGITVQDRDRWIANWEFRPGKEYTPFIRTQDVSSRGYKSRVPSTKCRGRVYHFLSANEYFYFLILEFDSRVLEIYEQYPLLPLERTLAIAKELGVKHPRYNGNGVFMPATLDFIVVMNDMKRFAVSIKQDDALDHERTVEKENIAHHFCELEGTPWELVTDDMVKNVFTSNLDKLHGFALLSEVDKRLQTVWMPGFLDAISENPYLPIAHSVEAAANYAGISYSKSTGFLFRSIWEKLIYIDLTKPIGLEKTVVDLGVRMNG